MRIRKINLLQKLLTGFFCLAILSQSSIASPVLCFETDGHLNIEAVCDVSCKLPKQIDDTHQDDCDDCFDINLWNYNPDLAFIINSNNSDNINFESTQPFIFLEIVSKIQLPSHLIKPNLLQFFSLIKTTILLI